MRSADRIAGAGLLALGVGFSVGALKHYAYWGENGPGPAFLPFWLGAVMAVLALMLTLLVFIGEAFRDAFDPRNQ